ncbi:DUF3429 domain-containing protein [Sphingomonas sp. TDK1]|uniref:DUF3429 domain-containing protein n=1 Tax=Sphingomonas sp. TDK1 TaxID=453247 RepID=UPI0007D90089|nr:DUF3429 domain-containing protein [Sphingomonas sp. TDK1]OAN60098.1 hypothetical protein A7X12_03185 [Sphingomonas sp. TDK1]
MENHASLAPAARMLGYAGLLPLIGCAAGLVLLPMHRVALLDAGFGYAALIFSFLGGLWWGQGIARGRGSPALFAIAVLPSLIAWGLILVLTLGWTTQEALVVLGSAILLSPIVDLALGRTQPRVQGWIALRLQLSTGLGALTLALAVL